jgi:hypothetical protein
VLVKKCLTEYSFRRAGGQFAFGNRIVLNEVSSLDLL